VVRHCLAYVLAICSQLVFRSGAGNMRKANVDRRL
jgi:hypothetical protein